MNHHSHDFEKAIAEGSGVAPKIVFAALIAAVMGALYAKLTGLI